MAEEISFSFPFGKIAAKTWGPLSGKPILAVHGWLDNAATFDKLAPLLSEYRFLSIDLPGHGNSFHLPPGLNYHLIDSLTYLAALLDHLKWEKSIFLGHSLGGAILAMLAGTRPDLAEKLVLIEAIGPHSNPPDEMPGRIAQFFEESVSLKGKKKPVYADTEAATAARQKVGGISLETARILTSRGLEDVPGGVTWKSDARLRLPSLQRLTEEEVHAFLKRIECPSLLITGSEGFLNHDSIREGVKARKRLVKNLKVVELKGNHHLHLENAEKVAAEIQAFLKA
jgi:pimeloyl-ACP methyl ester carboxylesterase